MPTFMQSLASNPGGSGIYGANNSNRNFGAGDALDLVNQLKDREMQDFKNKALFMSDLSMKQNRVGSIFDPQQPQNPQNPQQPMNTVLAHDPNQVTGYEKARIGLEQAGQGIEKSKIAQTGKLGQEAIDVRTAQEKLNQQKSDQINAQKTADMQRKIDESNTKIDLANRQLEQRTSNAEDQIKAHKDLAAAVEERHKLELAQRDTQFKRAQDNHEAQIKIMEDRLKQSGRTKTTTKVNEAGTERTTETERGGDETIQAIGKDGKTYNIPANKLNDKDADGTPHWKKVGGE